MTNKPQTKTEYINGLVRSHRRFMRSLKTAKRKEKMFKLIRFVAWALIFFDAWFSYQVIVDFSESHEFALFSAVFIAALQWVISNAIFTRTMGDFMNIDKNRNGEVSFSEWLRWGITMTAVLTAYGADILTNVIGINERGLGSIIFLIPGVPQWEVLGTACAYIFAAVLCFGDEILQYLADDALANIEEEMPRLRMRAAQLEAQMEKAGAFAETVVPRGAEEGTKAGQAYKI